jgi:hypothetical protein
MYWPQPKREKTVATPESAGKTSVSFVSLQFEKSSMILCHCSCFAAPPSRPRSLWKMDFAVW